MRRLTKRTHDRFVLFDMPPALSSDDVLTFVPDVDAIMLVAEKGLTTREQLTAVYCSAAARTWIRF
jgi:protein-tyrosine kinase